MARIIQIITLLFLSFLIMSASCDKGTEGCTDNSLCDYQGDGIEDENCACNFDKDAIIDDGSCNYPEENFDCEGKCLTEIDCAGECGGDAEIDCCGICDIDITNDPPEGSNGDCTEDIQCGCMDHSKCNFIPDATHNDGTCAANLSEFGGLSDGNDCNGDCSGAAVLDECDLCVGGTTNYGKCWQIEIKSIAIFKLQNGTSMGSDTNSIIIGTSKYALDGYNGAVSDNEDTDCISGYNDFLEPIGSSPSTFENKIRFFTPHDDEDEWDEWGSNINFDIEPHFDRDIRANDYFSLSSEDKGMNWFAVIEPTLSDTFIEDENGIVDTYETIIDSIKFQITHLDGIKCSEIKIYLDREKGEFYGGLEVENVELGIGVETDREINVTINVSNICIQKSDELCPDGD